MPKNESVHFAKGWSGLQNLAPNVHTSRKRMGLPNSEGNVMHDDPCYLPKIYKSLVPS
jgi:hypothetical protein